ncbi:hypothetical protein [Streptomyces halobius]|uniref:Uncharacterized protein n=1 Tax=Streptomyces halobius TaxID=2879846 RepID=A0ABY4MK32_9ACTN|nr:hypothetical protein [Streptomyces halobius]UQA98196.1 hypothetical protein K9S39_23185 [Streptomyces halobius]
MPASATSVASVFDVEENHEAAQGVGRGGIVDGGSGDMRHDPSSAFQAKAATEGAFTGLLLGLGAVALPVLQAA